MDNNQTVFRKEDRFTLYTIKTERYPNPKPVRAKWLYDKKGHPVINPRTQKPYIAPADYSLEDAITLGHSIHTHKAGRIETLRYFIDNFGTNKPQDLQRFYNGQTIGGVESFVEEFRDIASFHLGLVTAAAGLQSIEAVIGGGGQNLINKHDKNDKTINTDGEFWNNPRNPPNIREGFKFYQNDARSGASAIPVQPPPAPLDAFDYLDSEEFNPPKPDLKIPKDFIKPTREDKETPHTQIKLNSINESDKILAHNKKTHYPGLEEPVIKDVFEKYADVMGTKDKPEEVIINPVTTQNPDNKSAPLLLSGNPLPQKGPERVDTDPSYNPFNREQNGFEDLEGEVHIWKKDPVKKDQLIREAGREKDFGLDIDLDADGRPLPKKGPERVKRDPDYNPFDVALNGEEDLEGEAFIWKTDPLKKNRLIKQAGRANFFGLEGEIA